MLLQKWREYSERLVLPPTLYVNAPVRYIIDLDVHGQFLGLIDNSDSANSRDRRGRRRLVPQVNRAVAIKPLLLADNAEYTFGLGRQTSHPGRVEKCHQAYLRQLVACVAAAQDPGARAVLAFLSDDPVSELSLDESFDRGGTITFRVDSKFVVDSRAVQGFWADCNAPVDAQQMQCLVCGRQRPILDRLQAKVKGVPGGQTSGTSIISANAPAFESYGLEASLIAPTCADCGERFTKAANDLIDRQSYRFSGGIALYWTVEEADVGFMATLDNPDPNEVRALVDSILIGRFDPHVEPQKFYATVLTGSGGRTVVREWIDTTVGDAKRRVAQWHARLRVVDAWGHGAQPLGLYALAGATARRVADVPTPTFRVMWHAALTGVPLPIGLLTQATRRMRADRDVSYPQAALIKAVLLGQAEHKDKEGILMDLESTTGTVLDTTAYRCGRLMAVLEETQRQAIAGVRAGTGASVVDRYFAKASTAPAMVFGTLVVKAVDHLSKLERDRPGAYHGLQQRLEEILQPLRSGFPRTLRPEQQGEFALGYYHQRAANRAAALEARDRRAANQEQASA